MTEEVDITEEEEEEGGSGSAILESFERLSNTTKLFFLALITSGIAYLQYEDYIIPAYENKYAAESEYDRLASDLSRMSSGVQNLATVRAEKQRVDQELQRLLDLLPKELNSEKLLALLNEKARETGVELESFVPRERAQGGGGGSVQGVNPPPLAPVNNQPPVMPGSPNGANNLNNNNDNTVENEQVDDQIESTPIKVVVNGNFYQILRFLDKSLSIPRIIRLHEIYLRKHDADGGQGTVVPPGGIPLNAQGQPIQPQAGKKKKRDKKLNAELTFMSYSQKIVSVPFAGFEPPAQ